MTMPNPPTGAVLNAAIHDLLGDVPEEFRRELSREEASKLGYRWFCTIPEEVRKTVTNTGPWVWWNRHEKPWRESLEAYVAEKRTPIDWTGHLATTADERMLADGRAVMLCEVLRERKGWGVRVSHEPPKGWYVQFALPRNGVFFTPDDASALCPTLAQAVCEAAYRAGEREQSGLH